MIVSPDGETAVCTPTKCGSTALERACLARGWSLVKPRNRCDLAHLYERRLLVVRHPVARYWSMYWHTSQREDWWAFATTPEEFFTLIRRERRRTFPDLWKRGDKRGWTYTFAEYARDWRPHEVHRLEDGLECVVGFEVPFALPPDRPEARARRLSVAETFAQLEPSTLEWFVNLHRHDVDLYYAGDWACLKQDS